MKIEHYLAIIDFDTDKLDEINGPTIVEQMTRLKKMIDLAGSCDYYRVTDVKAVEKFKAELRRLNK
jgi:hypothetical protein